MGSTKRLRKKALKLHRLIEELEFEHQVYVIPSNSGLYVVTYDGGGERNGTLKLEPSFLGWEVYDDRDTMAR